MAAIGRGDYPQAYDLLQQTAEAGTQTGKAIGAVLLALIERFDEADRLLEAADVAALRPILQGERERATRWRDREANGSLRATDEDPLIPMYVAIATAFVHDNQDLAEQAKAKLAEHARPIAGKLTFVDGEVMAFTDITDGDDSIGQMLETYCGEGLLYFPFATVRRIEVLPKANFLDHPGANRRGDAVAQPRHRQARPRPARSDRRRRQAGRVLSRRGDRLHLTTCMQLPAVPKRSYARVAAPGLHGFPPPGSE